MCWRAFELAAFGAQPWAADAVRLRRWDDRAKTPGNRAVSIEGALALLEGVALLG
jgi:predicted HD phosphohydrolase